MMITRRRMRIRIYIYIHTYRYVGVCTIDMYITCTCIYIYNIAIAPPPKPSCHPSPLFVPCLITPAESQTLWHLEGFLISGSFGSVHSENKKHTMGFDRWGYGCLKMVNTSRPQEWLFRRENDDKPENLAVLYVQTNLY